MTKPTWSTPAMALTASIMRRCVAGILSMLYSAIPKFASTINAFLGSKPKSLLSDRASPRTATKEEVTSTAQIAICAPSSSSRTVTRRPMPPADPDLTIELVAAELLRLLRPAVGLRLAPRLAPMVMTASTLSVHSGMTGSKRWDGRSRS